MEKEFVVYQSKWKQAGLSVLGVFMTLLGLFVLMEGLAESGWLWIIIGVIGFLFFGWCEIQIIRQLIRGKQLVVLKPEGFCDYSTAYATRDQLIPWSQVSAVENKEIVGQSFVTVYLKDPEAFMNGLSGLQRKAVAANVKLGFGPVNISLQSAKGCSDEQLIEEMHRYLEAGSEGTILSSLG